APVLLPPWRPPQATRFASLSSLLLMRYGGLYQSSCDKWIDRKVRAVRGRVAAGRATPEFGEDRFEHWQHHPGSLCANDHIPKRFEFLPTGRVREMTEGGRHALVCRGAPKD